LHGLKILVGFSSFVSRVKLLKIHRWQIYGRLSRYKRGGAARRPETSDCTLINKQINETKSGGAGFAAKPLAIPRCCRPAQFVCF